MVRLETKILLMNSPPFIKKDIRTEHAPSIDEQFAFDVNNILNGTAHKDSAVTDVSFITVDFLCECIQSLKLRKTPGHDNITNEHIVFNSNDFVVHVCYCVQLCGMEQ